MDRPFEADIDEEYSLYTSHSPYGSMYPYYAQQPFGSRGQVSSAVYLRNQSDGSPHSLYHRPYTTESHYPSLFLNDLPSSHLHKRLIRASDIEPKFLSLQSKLARAVGLETLDHAFDASFDSRMEDIKLGRRSSTYKSDNMSPNEQKIQASSGPPSGLVGLSQVAASQHASVSKNTEIPTISSLRHLEDPRLNKCTLTPQEDDDMDSEFDSQDPAHGTALLQRKSVSDNQSKSVLAEKDSADKREAPKRKLDVDKEEASQRQRRKFQRWTTQEDEILRKAVTSCKGKKNWNFIAAQVPGRDNIQCIQRWKTSLCPGIVKGSWQPHEDSALMKMMLQPGRMSWVTVARGIPGRTPKQCRERWNLTLDPTINRSPWTEEEDLLLLKLYREQGSTWAVMRHSFDGRTENALKSRCNCLLRGIKRDESIVWTPELTASLSSVARRYNYHLETIKKHLPKPLKGISIHTIRQHCPEIVEMEKEVRNETEK